MIVSTVEMHTGGEPTRIIVDGWPAFEAPAKAAFRFDADDPLRDGSVLS